jgi:mono/diheme cytochrome c family protein
MTKNISRLLANIIMTPTLAGFFTVSISGAFAQSENPATMKNEHDQYAELAKAPEKARAKRNPFENDPDAIAAGRKLFQQHCAECHGMNAEGRRKAPSLVGKEVQGAAPGAIFWILTNGVVRRGMPDWSKLPEQQIWQVISYVKSLGPDARPAEERTPLAEKPE